MTSVFISFNVRDRGFAEQLASLVTKIGVDVWIDLSEVRLERKWDPELQSALDGCQTMIVVVSPASVISPKVTDEWQYYLETGKRVVPVIWRPTNVPAQLQRAEYVDFHEGNFKAAVARLRAELGLADSGAAEGKLHVIQSDEAAHTYLAPGQRMERFTQRARRVLSLAQEEAERLQHNYIGTEHLLLGLIREEGGIGGRVLRELGLEQRRVEELVERMTRASPRPTRMQPELSPGTKRVLELAVDEARRMKHQYIGTEHLLLGLARLTEGVAVDILKRLGVSPEEVRRQTHRVLQTSPLQNPPDKSKPDKSDPPPAEPKTP